MRGEFEQKFSKNSNAWGVARGGGGCLSFDFTGTLAKYKIQIPTFCHNVNKTEEYIKQTVEIAMTF